MSTKAHSPKVVPKQYPNRKNVQQGKWKPSQNHCVVEYKTCNDETLEIESYFSTIPLRWIDQVQRLVRWPPAGQERQEPGDDWQSYEIVKIMVQRCTKVYGEKFVAGLDSELDSTVGSMEDTQDTHTQDTHTQDTHTRETHTRETHTRELTRLISSPNISPVVSPAIDVRKMSLLRDSMQSPSMKKARLFPSPPSLSPSQNSGVIGPTQFTHPSSSILSARGASSGGQKEADKRRQEEKRRSEKEKRRNEDEVKRRCEDEVKRRRREDEEKRRQREDEEKRRQREDEEKRRQREDEEKRRQREDEEKRRRHDDEEKQRRHDDEENQRRHDDEERREEENQHEHQNALALFVMPAPHGQDAASHSDWQHSVTVWLSDLMTVSREQRQTVLRLEAKVDHLEERIEMMGRRVEPGASSFNLEYIKSLERFEEMEEELKDDESLTLLVSRLKHLGTYSSLGRTISNIFKNSLSPYVYKHFSYKGKKVNGLAKSRFDETSFCKAMIRAITSHKEAAHGTDDRQVKAAIADQLKKANSEIAALVKAGQGQ